jgi:hypothetical protein
MEEQKYYIKISPEVIKSDIRTFIYTASTGYTFSIDQECCDFTSYTQTFTATTGTTTAILPMSLVVTSGSGGTSLMTGLTIPILFTQNTVDLGYYSVFEGAITQKDVITNFLFSAVTGANSSTYYVYNTSDITYQKFLKNSTFKIDWGDGSQIQTITNFAPNSTPHVYPTAPATYTIKMSGITMFGLTIIEKKINIPFTEVEITNPKGTAYFIPQGGEWSGVPISYDYIFSGDSNTDLQDHISSNYTTIPIIVTGFTKSSLNDLAQYNGNTNIKGMSFKQNQQVTGTSNTVGVYNGPTNDGLGVSYTINGIDYYDYNDGTTIYVAKSSGLTSNWLVSSGLTKDETLINVVDQPQIFSNVYIERGKNSVFERVRRLGEVSTIGGLTIYGYKFFNVNKND